MGKARRNKIAGRTNPKLFTNENLLGPVREAVLGELKQGKPKPSIIVVDTTTVGTNWMPRVVDDVTGVPGQPAAMSMYATPDEFAKAEGPDAQSLERVRLGLAAHPEDVVVCAISDHGVEIANVEMTAANADGHKVTLEQLSEAYAAKRQGMDELHAAAIERAVDVYGLDKEFDTYDGKNATQTQRVLTLVTKGLLNVVIDRTLKTREEGYHPAVIGVWPDDVDCEVGCWDTMEKFERTRQENTRHKAWKEQVREAAAAHPGSIVVCWPPDALATTLSLTAKEAQSGYTVWAVDTKSMQIERCG